MNTNGHESVVLKAKWARWIPSHCLVGAGRTGILCLYSCGFVPRPFVVELYFFGLNRALGVPIVHVALAAPVGINLALDGVTVEFTLKFGGLSFAVPFAGHL